MFPYRSIGYMYADWDRQRTCAASRHWTVYQIEFSVDLAVILPFLIFFISFLILFTLVLLALII